MRALRLLPLVLFLMIMSTTEAAEVRVAVAANFAATLHTLAEDFSSRTGHRVMVSSGSTGKHYAQIRNGATFDVFLAADSARPERLEAEGIGIANSRFTYAIGRLALWVPGQHELGPPERYLRNADVRHLAIANPRLAPYGLAAEQALRAWGLWERLQPKLVRGENIAQAFQFVATGNASAGLVALPSLLAGGRPVAGSYRVIPPELHQPIDQQGLLLRRGEAADAFLDYLQGEVAAGLIRSAGYEVPAA